MIKSWGLTASVKNDKFYLYAEFKDKEESNGLISFCSDKKQITRLGGCYEDEIKTTCDGCPVVRRIQCL
jgi:hypothetical protein